MTNRRRDAAFMADAYTRSMRAAYDTWASGMTQMAARFETGAMSPAELAADAVNYASEFCRIGYEWLESLVSGTVVERIQSDEFTFTRHGSGMRTLELVGPLVGQADPQATVERSRVRIVPAKVHGSQSAFRLDVNVTGLRGDAYVGAVQVKAGDNVEQTVSVVVQVP